MTAQKLIAHDIPALSIEQTGRDAFHFLSDYHVKHLPVVDEKRLVGLISEEDIFNHKLSDPLSEYDFALMRPFAAKADDHIFEVMRVMGLHRLTVMPVVDAEEHYLGLISQNDLLPYFAKTASLTENGAVLVLEVPRRDYMLSTISRIVEEEGVRVLGAFVSNGESDPENVEITLKLDRHDLSRVIPSLERHDYIVKETFGEIEYSEALKERYDSFMKYLNM
jgi:acetoin utilization protein AcuB